MIKLLIFAFLIVGIAIAFPLSLDFFNGGFSALVSSINLYSSTFFGFFTNIFSSLFNAPILSIFLGIGFAIFVISLIFKIIGGDN